MMAPTLFFASATAMTVALIGTAMATTANEASVAELFSTASQVYEASDTRPERAPANRVFTDCRDGCPQMIEIPAGAFVMGSKLYAREQPQHPVTFPTAIAVATFETTFDEWDVCVKEGGCAGNRHPPDEGWGKGQRPVINVSWNDAKDYVSWLSHKTGKTYRLLTEAEWEYAARAGSTTIYSWGDRIDCDRASYDGGQGSACAAHTGRSSLRGTQSVGAYPANEWGLHDMLGNVWEWCEDNWRPDYHGAPSDSSEWPGGDTSMRVLRGGAWNYSASGLRTADRNWFPAGGRTDFIGFRVARQLDSAPDVKVSGLR